MLRYKVKLNEPKGYNEIKCDELYLSPDLSFISGVTDSNYCLINGQHISIEFNNDEKFHDSIIETKNVLRQGYVIFEQEFDVEEYKDYKGFYYVDGKYYFTTGTSINVLGQECTINDNKINVNVTYWVENGKITIGENTYDVDIQLKNDGTELYSHYITLKGGVQLPINKCSKEYWKTVTKFIIRKNNDFDLKLTYSSCAKKVPYFYYGNEKYYLTYDNTSKKFISKIDNKEFIQVYNKVKLKNGTEEYNVEYEWRNSASGDFIHLFLNMPQYKFTSAQKILVESNNVIHTKCDILFTGAIKNDDGYIIYCGKRYDESVDTIDFLVIGDKEYELHYINGNIKNNNSGSTDSTETENSDSTNTENTRSTDTKKAYIIYNETVYLIKINGERGVKLSQHAASESKEYNIKKYHYVDINGDKFLVKKHKKILYDGSGELIEVTDGSRNPIEIEYVEVVRKEKFVLTIIDVINNSMLRCRVDIGEDGDSSGICNFIAANYVRLNFKLSNPVFEEKNVTKDSFILASVKGEDEAFDTIKLFNPSYYIKLPMLVGNDMGINANQEDILENIFFKREKEKSINPYVDMEREIYYPCCISETDFNFIEEIQFDLHFRSRNLEDWKINEDVFKTNTKTVKCDWNIFDNYKNYSNNNLSPEILNTDNLKHYQPADLLYFLNFDTDDVFYQKSKISKSFLRLLFFDSMDVANQTLLYSCTVFMNENKLYKTYIDNVIRKDNLYVSVSDEININEPLTSSTISVYNDTCDGNGKVTFEKEKRLAATFSVKNRYKSEESSEGFYLYIFKDYCEKLHEKTIYMKVEFNHAGEGRTINFTMPFNYNDKGEPTLLDLSPKSPENTVLSKFKEGYGLSDLYKHLFIPINVVYRENEKKYVYYLPKGLVQHNEKGIMKFNLYELKIKDES